MDRQHTGEMLRLYREDQNFLARLKEYSKEMQTRTIEDYATVEIPAIEPQRYFKRDIVPIRHKPKMIQVKHFLYKLKTKLQPYGATLPEDKWLL